MRVTKLILGFACCIIWACANEVETKQERRSVFSSDVSDDDSILVDKEGINNGGELFGSSSSEAYSEVLLVASSGGAKLRLREIKCDGLTSEKFRYNAQNRLSIWTRVDEYRFFYLGDLVDRVEVWEDTYDGWEQLSEIKPIYEGNRLMGYLEFETEEERVLVREYRLKWDDKMRIVAFVEYDFMDQKELVSTTKLTYSDGLKVYQSRFNRAGKLIDSTEIIYDKALNALSFANFPMPFFDGGIVTFQQEMSRVTKVRQNTITTTWENFSDEAGVLHKAILTLPRNGKPVEFEYIYTPDDK